MLQIIIAPVLCRRGVSSRPRILPRKASPLDAIVIESVDRQTLPRGVTALSRVVLTRMQQPLSRLALILASPGEAFILPAHERTSEVMICNDSLDSAGFF